MSTFAPFIAAIKTKILNESTYITDSNNMLLTNNVDISSLPDSAFPRVEIFVEDAQAEGYESQRTLEWNFRFWFTGYIRRTPTGDGSESLWTETDFTNIWSFAEETMAIVFGLMDDHQADNSIAPSFIMFKGTPVLSVNCEIIPNISVFMGFVEVIFQKEDTNG